VGISAQPPSAQAAPSSTSARALASDTLTAVLEQKRPLDEVLDAIHARTRVVFLTNPNNPTGVTMPLEAIRAIGSRRPTGTLKRAGTK